MNFRRSHTRCVDHGFTILELVMVISIISILAFTAYPLFTAPSQFPLDSAANVVESDINLTQIGAMTKGASRSLIFTAGAGEYLYNNGSDDGQGLSRDLKELGGSIKIGSDLTITFNSTGEPVDTSAMIIVINGHGMERRVTVEPYTGKTNIE